MSQELGVFAKYWQPGEVKTRLAASYGDEPAARFHQACLRTVARRFSRVGRRRTVVFTPADREADFAAACGGQWRLLAQAPGDLGRRMASFFARMFADGASAVVLIGSDSPTLPERFVTAAFERLRQVDAVLGPAADGGYYLIGLSKHQPAAFEGIAWSTPEVLRQTLDRLAHGGCRHELLPSWYDVDTPRDLRRLRDELAADSREEFSLLRGVVAQLRRTARGLE